MELGLLFQHEFGRYPTSNRTTMFARRPQSKNHLYHCLQRYSLCQTDTLTEHVDGEEVSSLPVIDIEFLVEHLVESEAVQWLPRDVRNKLRPRRFALHCVGRLRIRCPWYKLYQAKQLTKELVNLGCLAMDIRSPLYWPTSNPLPAVERPSYQVADGRIDKTAYPVTAIHFPSCCLTSKRPSDCKSSTAPEI
jgi:hypothetical protein